MDVRVLPLTSEFVSFAIKLLTTVTEEMEKADGFDEDLLRDQLIKALQLKAARAILAHPDCLRVALASPLVRQLRDPVSDLRKMPTPSSPPASLPAYPRISTSGMVVFFKKTESKMFNNSICYRFSKFRWGIFR